MNYKKSSLILMVLLGFATAAFAQQNLIYNHYFINPFLYNPAMIAPSGYSEVYLNYRKQWSGFEGAPQTATFNLQMPLSYKSGLAVTGFQDEAGLIKTTTGLVSFSYQIYLGKRVLDLHKIGFGISAGYTSSRVDSDDPNDFDDPVLGNRTSSLDGQFGMYYQYNRFRLGFSIPRLFENYVASENSFNAKGISQIKNTSSFIAYDFKVSPTVSFEPIVTYRTYENLDDQIEALASLKFANIGWIGGAYRQDYGAFAFLGLNVKEKLKVGYAYEFATEQSDRIGYGTHEVQVVFRIGKKQFSRPQVLAANKPQTTTTPVDDNTSPLDAPRNDEEPQDQVTSDDRVAIDQQPAEQQPVVQEPVVQEPVVQERVAQPVQQQDVAREEPARETTPETTPVTRPVQETQPANEDPNAVRKLDGNTLAPGHYVVVGAFRNVQNALDYTATLKRAGYPAHVAYHPERAYYIVHMLNATTVEEARIQRDKYRQMSRYSFRDTWILSIE